MIGKVRKLGNGLDIKQYLIIFFNLRRVIWHLDYAKNNIPFRNAYFKYLGLKIPGLIYKIAHLVLKFKKNM